MSSLCLFVLLVAFVFKAFADEDEVHDVTTRVSVKDKVFIIKTKYLLYRVALVLLVVFMSYDNPLETSIIMFVLSVIAWLYWVVAMPYTNDRLNVTVC